MRFILTIVLLIITFPAIYLIKENFYLLAPIILSLGAIIKRSIILVKLSLITLLLCLLTFGLLHSSEIRLTLAQDPGQAYATDMRSYLKTLYLMKEGTGFYPALNEAFHRQTSALPPDVWGWKQPSLFYIWHFTGNPESIWVLAFINASAFLMAGYLLARKYIGPYLGLLGPIIAFPYFLYFLTNLSILLVEWWAITPFLVAIALRAYGYKIPALCFFLITLGVREYFIFPISIYLLIDLYGLIKNKLRTDLMAYLGLIIIFVAYYLGIHLHSLQLIGESHSVRGLNPGSLAYFNLPLAYVSWNYLLGPLRLFTWLCAITTVLAVIKWKMVGIVAVSFIPLMFFTLGASVSGILTPWHDYWGIIFIPLLLVTAPIIWLSEDRGNKKPVGKKH